MTHVVGICGSLRMGSLNRKALLAAGELMPSPMRLEIVEMSDLPMYNLDVQQAGWPPSVLVLRDRIRAADAVLVATPEYNGSMPAALKNAIDWMSRFKPSPFYNMPCAVLSASVGQLGGGRVQYEFRRSMSFLNALVMLQPEVFISGAHQKFDEAGRFNDGAGREFLAQQMAAFQSWIASVQAGFVRPAGEGP